MGQFGAGLLEPGPGDGGVRDGFFEERGGPYVVLGGAEPGSLVLASDLVDFLAQVSFGGICILDLERGRRP